MKRIDEERLLLAVGEVGDDLIAQAERQPARRRPYAKWGAMAACFCLIALFAAPHVLGPASIGSSNNAAPPEDYEAAESAMEGENSDPSNAGDVARDENIDSAASPEGAVKGTDCILLISPDETEVTVAHILGGQCSETVAEGKALEALQEWAGALPETMEYRAFAPGRSPGDTDGGEVYTFTGATSPTEFSYVINGPEDCYVLYEGDWYAVADPVDPPVDF